jgi:prepilin-type N-terminal cleavage/methylation domain-containing protein
MRVRSARLDRGDSGFALMEVIVAMTLLGVLLTAGLAMLVRTTSVAGQNVRRTTAANLLTRQLELAKGTRATDIPMGTSASPSPVGGTTYTVTQSARYVSSSDGASLCDGDAGLLYKLVTVTVTWPDMQAVKPVRGDVLRGMGIGSDGSDAGLAALAITVRDSAGSPKPGIEVTLRPSGGRQITDSSGCVVFLDLTPGTYAGDARSPDGYLNGSSGGRAVQGGAIGQDDITVYPPPPPPPPPTPTPTPTSGGSSGPPTTTTAPSSPSSGSTDPFGGGGQPAPSTTTQAPPPPPPTTTTQPWIAS